MQENLKVRKPLGKGSRENPFVLVSMTRAQWHWVGDIQENQGISSVLGHLDIEPLKISSGPFLWLGIRKPGSSSTSEANYLCGLGMLPPMPPSQGSGEPRWR